MSAAEIIEQFKALPREEQTVVANFVREFGQSNARNSSPAGHSDEQPSGIRYATDEQAFSAGEAVLAEFPETFRRLAE